MKGDPLSSSSWIPRSSSATTTTPRHLPDPHFHQFNASSSHLDPSSHQSTSRGSLVPQTIANSFRSVFNRNPHRAPSAASLHSSYSESSSFNPPPYSHPETHDVHPYAAMVAAPLPVVSSRDMSDDEDDCCPVCLEPLSFSFRLPGEKPHIVPECGHSLHEVRLV